MRNPDRWQAVTYLGLGGFVNIITSSIARRTVFEQHSHSRTIKHKRKRLRDIVYSQKCTKSRCSCHFFSPLLAGGLSDALSLPPDPNGGMPAVLRISSPGPCFCRAICSASFNSRVKSSSNQEALSERDSVRFLPRAPNLFFHSRELSAGAVRRGARRFGLVSSQPVSTAAAGRVFAPRSIQSHWFAGRKKGWPSVSSKEWHRVSFCDRVLVLRRGICSLHLRQHRG